MWFAVRQSLYHAVDDALRDRVQGIRGFLEQHASSLSVAELQSEFREHSVLGPGGDLFQVLTQDGDWLYRSDPLYAGGVPIYRLGELSRGARFEDVYVQTAPLRFLSDRVIVNGRPYIVQVAVPLQEIQEGFRRFLWILLAALPAIVALATVGGYWMSRRALAPVDEITSAARSVTSQELSRRLPVPRTGDELQRLSETLNDMFERLEASFAHVARFTADASHELRTPVTLMRTTAELALRRERSSHDYREALAQILRELERTSGLIEDLLFLARADSASGVLSFSRSDIVETVREACDQGRLLAAAKHIEMETRLPAHPVYLDADASSLRRLFLILLDNAVKYTPPAGTVRVNLKQQDGSLLAVVSDTGIGIPAEDLPHVFDRFYRADRARSRDGGGAGLGLSIAQWIACVHHGQIEVESTPGRGSTFRVRLPLTASPLSVNGSRA
ncbi:MAG: HAMP domain-containing protein [Acidobacteria bacterium]|nr:HAMP domain-containing protein [Acidobacteriota bacterium]